MNDFLEAAKGDVQPEQSEAQETVSEDVQATEEAQPEQADEEVQGQENDPVTVPLPHLLQERHQRHELQKQVEDLQKQIEQLRESTHVPPDYDEDPKTYIDEQFAKLREEQSKNKPITQQELQQYLVMHQMQQQISQDHQKAKGKHPDLEEAIMHARNYYREMHTASGVPTDKISEVIDQAEMAFAMDAFQKGQSAAEAYYNHAVKQLGYQPKTKVEQKDPKAEQIKRAQEASTPIGGGDGGTEEASEPYDPLKAAFEETFAHMKRH